MENTGRVADRSMDAKLSDSAAAAEGFGQSTGDERAGPLRI
jgi:hypothetical protein